jgi:hypothetical protein
MKIGRATVYVAVALIAVAAGIICLMAKRNSPPTEVRGARTLYSGYVKIEPISLVDLKTELERLGCRRFGDTTRTDSPCNYEVHFIAADQKENIVIYPRGPGFGPSGFIVAEDRISATKDIPGLPDPSKYKAEVREDVSFLGDILKIRENSWKITETIYPFTAVY